MDFRVLGALEVWDGDERVEISGRLHPKILAGLLLNAGRTVSVSWLVDLLWDDEPPKTARRQVQNAVAALRRQLEPVREGLIERVGQEYRVNIADDELDLRRFEKKSSEARQLADSGQWREAFDSFGHALELWRGPAFDGLECRGFQPAAARLDDKYLSTYEKYAESALIVGQHEAVIEKLQELILAHPLRQRLHARLMHALHQSHRAQDALQVFETLRGRLSDELGLDPSGELKDMHVRILQDDPSLFPPTPNRSQSSPGSATPRLVPAELPTDVASFTGREEHMAALDRLRDSGAHTGIVSAITGIGGVGKTALAVHWGHARRADFPDGQLYINLRGYDEREPLTPYEAVSRLLRSLGHPANDVPDDLEQATNLYRSLLSDKRVLLLLDNARTAEQIRPLLPNSPGTLAVVTSRNRLSSLVGSYDAKPVELNVLSPEESLSLLAEMLGPEVVVDVKAAHHLAQLSGHLPLALRIVAANRIQNPHGTLMQFTTELSNDLRLSQMNVDGDSATDVTAVFELSYRALGDKTRGVFRYLGLIPGDDFTAGLVAKIAGIDETVVESALHELVDAYLLDRHLPHRFRLHDLVRRYTRERVTHWLDESERAAARDRLIDWYSLRPNQQLAEFDNIVATCEALASHPRLWVVAGALGSLASLGHGPHNPVRHIELALATARELGDVDGQIHSLRALGLVHLRTWDTVAATRIFEEAARLLPLAAAPVMEGIVHGDLGMAYYTNGHLNAAARHLKHATRVAEGAEDLELVITSSGNLGRVYRAMGRFDEARALLKRAEMLARNMKLLNRQVGALVSLAVTYVEMGLYDECFATAQEVLEMAQGIGASRAMAFAHQAIGKVHHVRSETAAAIASFDAAITIAQRESRISIQVELLHDKADLCTDVGDTEVALTCLSTAAALIATQPPDTDEKARHARVQCRLHTATHEFATAIAYGHEAVSILRDEREEPLRLAQALVALGEAHQGNGDPEAATDCWTEALQIFTDLDVPEAAKLRAKLDAPKPRSAG